MATVKTEVAVKEAPTECVQLFRLRPGKTHWHGEFAVLPSDELYLNALQARAFRDKFEPVDPKGAFADMVEPNEPFMTKARKRQVDEAKALEEVADLALAASVTSEIVSKDVAPTTVPVLEKK